MAPSTSNQGVFPGARWQDISKNQGIARVGTGAEVSLRVRRRLGSKKLGKLTFRLRAETGKRVDIFSRLNGFIERASRAPIENDENWTDVRKKRRVRENGIRDAFAMRASCISSFAIALTMSQWVGFFGRARDNLDGKTRSVTQSGDRPSVDFDKRMRRRRFFP